jgi:hypothetical protein
MFGHKPKVLHYGLQRSGTNFLEMVLNKKFRVRVCNSNKDRRNPLQKHFRLYDNKNVISDPQYINNIIIRNFTYFESLLPFIPSSIIVISKDPYSWFKSYTRWAEKCHWPPVSHHYIEEYNLFYSKWLEMSEQSAKIKFVRYCDLLQNGEDIIPFLEEKTGLTPASSGFSFRSGLQKVPQSSKFSTDRRDYYLSERYLKEFGWPEIDALNRHLDVRTTMRLGYEKRELP